MKAELLKECKAVLMLPEVAAWYDDNLMNKNQGDIIKQLEFGIINKEISIHNALFLAFITGFQWHINFENDKASGNEQV